MKIIKGMQKIPGGMMVIPLVIASIINTFAPHALKIGSFTTAIFSGAGLQAMIGLQLFFIGTRLKVRQAPEAIKRGTVLLLAKWVAGAFLGLLIAKLFGLSGILGVSVLAIISSVTGANGALYLALMSEYGEPTDSAAMSILNIHDGPFIAMMTLGITGLANIPLIDLLAAIIPLAVGAILGNIDDDFTKLFSPGLAVVIPFIGFDIGAGINLGNVLKAGGGGLFLGVMVMVIGGGFTFLADRYILRRPGYAGVALATAAGNTIATPAAIALIDPRYKAFVQSATVQISAAVILTAILVPLITDYVAKRLGSGKTTAAAENTAELGFH